MTLQPKKSLFLSKKRWPLSVLLSLFMFKIMKKISTKFCQWSSSMTAHMSMDRRRKELLLFFFTTHSRRTVYALFFSTGRVNVFYWVGNSLLVVLKSRSFEEISLIFQQNSLSFEQNSLGLVQNSSGFQLLFEKVS